MANATYSTCDICGADAHDYSWSPPGNFKTYEITRDNGIVTVCYECSQIMVSEFGFGRILDFMKTRDNITEGMMEALRTMDFDNLATMLSELRFVAEDPLLILDPDIVYGENVIPDEYVDKIICMFAKINRGLVKLEEDSYMYASKYISDIAPEVLIRRYGIEAEMLAAKNSNRGITWSALSRISGANTSMLQKYFKLHDIDKDNDDIIEVYRSSVLSRMKGRTWSLSGDENSHVSEMYRRIFLPYDEMEEVYGV